MTHCIKCNTLTEHGYFCVMCWRDIAPVRRTMFDRIFDKLDTLHRELSLERSRLKANKLIH